MASMSAKQTSCKQSGQRPLLFLLWTSVYGRKHWVSLSERHRWAERRESCFANRAQCRFAGLTISLAKRSDERGRLVVVLSVSVRGCSYTMIWAVKAEVPGFKGFFFLLFFIYIYTRGFTGYAEFDQTNNDGSTGLLWKGGTAAIFST